MRRLIIAAIAALLVIEISIAALTANGSSPEQSQVAPLAAGTRVDRPLGHLPLIDEQGQRTSLEAFHGRWVVLAPSLTLCHEVCPLMTGALMRLQDELRLDGLGDRVVIAEATVDPWRDSPARVRAYKRLTGADIRFLTGTQADIRRLWKTLGVVYERVPQDDPPDVDWWTHRPQTFDVTHTDAVFVIDPRGHLRVAVPGMPDVGGKLPARLASLLNSHGRRNLRHARLPWTVDQLRDDLMTLVGAGAPGVPAPSATQTRTRLAGSPKPLAALHAQGGQLLGGGAVAVRARLRALRGRPVVVNEWASWCPPCGQELPLFAAAAARYGTRVGFLGLNVNDSGSAAQRFLARHPVSYPSYFDDGAKAATALGGFVGLPTTVFIDAAGDVVAVHAGRYPDARSLEVDIERHALEGRR